MRSHIWAARIAQREIFIEYPDSRTSAQPEKNILPTQQGFRRGNQGSISGLGASRAPTRGLTRGAPHPIKIRPPLTPRESVSHAPLSSITGRPITECADAARLVLAPGESWAVARAERGEAGHHCSLDGVVWVSTAARQHGSTAASAVALTSRQIPGAPVLACVEVPRRV